MKIFRLSVITLSCLLIILTGCITVRPSSPSKIKKQINIMSFNIHHAAPQGRSSSDIEEIKLLTDFLKDNKVDICGLNEVDRKFKSKTNSRSNYINQPRSMADLYDAHYAFGSTLTVREKTTFENTKYIETGKRDFSLESEGNKGNYGNAILSVFPLSGSQNFGLAKIDGSEKRACLYSIVSMNNLYPYHLFVTHLSHDSHIDRVKQIEGILSLIKEKTGFQKVIFMGDLNFDSHTADKDEKDIIAMIKKAGLKDSAELFAGKLAAKTYPTSAPNKRLDYIFVSPDIEVIDYQVIETLLSDHFPVMITVAP